MMALVLALAIPAAPLETRTASVSLEACARAGLPGSVWRTDRECVLWVAGVKQAARALVAEAEVEGCREELLRTRQSPAPVIVQDGGGVPAWFVVVGGVVLVLAGASIGAAL